MKLDATKIKIMGRPFEHHTGKTIVTKKDTIYDPKDYLTSVHVINTLQDILKLPSDRRFVLGKDLPTAPSIPVLIA